MKLPVWGEKAERKVTSDGNWKQPLTWNRKARASGVRRRVFCSSLADVFENRPDLAPHRARLFRLIEETPHLAWLLLTKRPEHMVSLAKEAGWAGDWPENVWIGTTVEDQENAEARIPHLLLVPARVRFLSCEPLLGPVDLRRWGITPDHHHRNALTLRNGRWGTCSGCPRDESGMPYPERCQFTDRYDHNIKPMGIHWVICGGESGPGARPMHPDWARSLRDQCKAAGVAFHFKQYGDWGPGARCDMPSAPSHRFSDGTLMGRFGKKIAGRLLDGQEWNETP